MTTPSAAVPSGPGPDPRAFAPAAFAAPAPWSPEPGRPRRRWPTWLKVLVAVSALLVAVCGFGAVQFALNLNRVASTDREVNGATEAFIEDMRDGLSQAGYDGLCAEAKEEFAARDLATPTPDDEAVTGYRITATDVDYDRRQATVRVEVTRGGSTTREVYLLAEEGDRWKMCGFPPR